MRYSLLVASFLFVFGMAGCGPMGPSPLPPRLEAESQKQIDDAWEKALQPVDHLDRQATLDALVLSQAYQGGVDRLTFRSEKKFSGGMVVMEIHFDREKPNDDRFEVTIRDATGKLLRHLVYDRPEVETTCRDLHNPLFVKDRGPNDPMLEPDHAAKRAEVQKRIAAVEQIFPKQDEEDGTKKK